MSGGSGRIVGIDLGTTNSCVAVMIDGEVRVISNPEGSRTTPSVVAFTEEGERLVGQIAKRQAITNPTNTIYAAKRLIGRKLADPEIAGLRRLLPYQLCAADNGDAWVEVWGRAHSPSEIGAAVLTKMKEAAQAVLGEPVTRAIVTVPAYFNDTQRQATKDAGQIAGLTVERIINEPTAATLAYGLHERQDSRIVAVYDLGGGTFDISLLEMREGVFEVLATAGDTFLGGEDFDHAIVDWCAEQFLREHGFDLRSEKLAMQRLKEAAEKAKQELSFALETELNLPFIAAPTGQPLHFSASLSRRQLETLTKGLVERTVGPCLQVLQDAELEPNEIDEVLLVGGQTRMPMVIERVKQLFGREPSKSVNPDEVVAAGAAIQGAVLEGQIDGVLLLDVVPLPIGVETQGGVFSPLIPRNTTIPTRKSEVFSTTVDNQPVVNVHVLQGLRDMADDNKSLARFQLTDIPPAPRGVPQIQVTFEIDANGILGVTAKDLGTGRQTSVTVQPSSGLAQDQIDKLVVEAETKKGEDRVRRELVDLRNRAETLVYTCRRSLEVYGSALAPADREDIERDAARLESLLEASPGLAELGQALAALESSSHQIYEAMLSEAGPE
ncbi:molecular chaperone DnaK [Paraliomyxa miuraensis]|uniref:molecular chaperone DnaK n=1 Tax=Paraliomyxa miuraensis TaxID=376150 RepID=UPI0022588F68|nr:molecular chaperone DnaK [Paraliomyxa miuraensis]MCX4245864.1 molecular chaperone DnaK [Paraliomyxa miuraensis]